MKTNNLKPFTSDQSRDEAVKNGRKGGLNSGISKKRKKLLADQAKEIINLPVQETDKDAMELLQQFGLEASECNLLTVMLCAMINKAINGDTNAFKAFIDVLDENGNKKLERNLKKADIALKKLELEEKKADLERVHNDDAVKVVIVNDLPVSEEKRS